MKKVLCILLLALPTAACGGADSSPTGPSNTPQPYNQTMTGTVSAFGTVRHPLTISRAGNLTLRLTWQDPTVDLDLYLAVNACTSLSPSCGVLAASDAGVGTSEQINRTVASGEAFQIWIDNLHLTRPQNYTLTLTIE